MPFYALICRRCGQAFERKATVSQRSGREIACPSCGSTDLDTDYSSGRSAAIGRAAPKAAHAEPAGCPHAGECGCGCCKGGGQ
ncbi:MAG TPA: zinc ribbon domain-containing protein [Firmicutes bacterium]|nr:zinc ribbon domain-containing protein [Bacillota bacterium]HJD24472.1 zinc ribbon domain-containing protein [Bacillota bacterium]